MAKKIILELEWTRLRQRGGRGELVVLVDMTRQSGGGEEENHNNLSPAGNIYKSQR